MLCLSIFSVACTDNAIIEDDGDFLVKPLDNDYTMESISLDGYQSFVEIPDQKGNLASTRSDCPDLDLAISQLARLDAECDESPLYCEYLKLFWRIEAQMAGINCGITAYCTLCNVLIPIAKDELRALKALGLGKIYVQDLKNKILLWQDLCDNCGD